MLEYHDYEQGGDLPGHESDELGQRVQRARAVGKPLVVAEIGMPAGACRPLEERHATLKQIIDRQRAEGTAGALLWAFVPDPRLDECTVDIGPDDPLLGMVGNQAP